MKLGFPMSFVLLIFFAFFSNAALPQSSADDGSLPVCSAMSHDRLLVRAERDVCAPTLHKSGRPLAVGLMPTQCSRNELVYQIDVVGNADRCLPVPSKKQTRSSTLKKEKSAL